MNGMWCGVSVCNSESRGKSINGHAFNLFMSFVHHPSAPSTHCSLHHSGSLSCSHTYFFCLFLSITAKLEVQCNVSEVLLEPKKQNKTEDQNQWTIMTTYKFIITMKSLSHINLQKHSKKNRRHNNNNEKRKTKTCNDIHWFQSNHFYSRYRTTKILTVKLQD